MSWGRNVGSNGFGQTINKEAPLNHFWLQALVSKYSAAVITLDRLREVCNFFSLLPGTTACRQDMLVILKNGKKKDSGSCRSKFKVLITDANGKPVSSVSRRSPVPDLCKDGTHLAQSFRRFVILVFLNETLFCFIWEFSLCTHAFMRLIPRDEANSVFSDHFFCRFLFHHGIDWWVQCNIRVLSMGRRNWQDWRTPPESLPHKDFANSSEDIWTISRIRTRICMWLTSAKDGGTRTANERWFKRKSNRQSSEASIENDINSVQRHYLAASRKFQSQYNSNEQEALHCRDIRKTLKNYVKLVFSVLLLLHSRYSWKLYKSSIPFFPGVKTILLHT